MTFRMFGTKLSSALRYTISDRVVLPLLAGLTLPLYAYLLARGYGTLFARTEPGLTFNSMLVHLLSGTFDVDPEAVGREGFAVNGKVYSYFGILPAILRLPWLLFVDLSAVDVTGPMCLLAAWLGGLVRVATVLMIYRAVPMSSTRMLGAVALVASVVLGGAQVPFLKPSIFQEACFWASTLSAIFVYLGIRGLISRNGFSGRMLSAMAVVAGLTLLTRVTAGLGLYCALGLLLLFRAWCLPTGGQRRSVGLLKAVLTRETLIPLLLLALFVLLVGGVNTARWGKPWVFVPLRLQIMNNSYPDRIPRLDQYGEFNLRRLPYALMYYFLPIWIIVTDNGRFLLSEIHDRLFDALELPPSTFILSDPLLLLFFGWFAWHFRAAKATLSSAFPLLAGLLVPPLLILIAASLTYRYRLEFFPALEFGAYLGFFLLCRDAQRDKMSGMLHASIIACAAVGIVVGQVNQFTYRASPFGPASQFLAEGTLYAGPGAYYLARFQHFYPRLHWR